VGDNLRALAMANASAPEIEEKLRELGVPSLRDLALRKVQAGIVSAEEVVRVLGAVS
jgi:type II secretory ATPase GspE/PulE/Tfp pilus assembly ATPase PilB-like protein